MKTKATLALAALAACALSAHEAWNDISAFRINKEEPCAFYTVETDFESAKKPVSIEGVESVRSTEMYKSLNGDWKFLFAKNHAESKGEYKEKNFDDSAWDTIDVPNSWQCRGYDRIFFNNMPMEFCYDFEGNLYKEFAYGKDGKKDVLPPAAFKPFIPEAHRQIGVYRRKFTLPENWSGKNVFVQFDGVRTGLNVYVNGKFAGYSEDSFSPAKFDITKLVDFGGENTIVAEVYKYTTGAYMEMQDMPHMIGIIRDVNLIARNPLHIDDYYAPTDISDDLKSAEASFEFKLDNRSDKPSRPAKLSAYLFDSDGGQFGGSPLFEVGVPVIAANESARVEAKHSFKNFKLWSPDNPNLYFLVFRLCDENGAELETIKADFGFKKFEINAAKRQLVLNKKRFFIKGANHHDWSPDKGKAMDFSWFLKDVMEMKKLNMNAVRTSHYPKDPRFYMLCSRLGILVLDEANQEMHFFRKRPSAADLDIYVPASVDRMRSMVVRDRNVPSVAIFSVGNESAPFYAKAIAEMANVGRNLSSRSHHFIHSEAESSDIVDGRANGGSDFFSPMYGGVKKMNFYLRLPNEKKPFFYCEYCHCKGNSLGDLHEQWKLIRSQDSLNGGFLWDLVDQGLYMPRKDDPSKKYISDGRDWGTKPNSGSNSIDGVLFADRTHSAKYYEVRRIYQDIQISEIAGKPLELEISNEFIDTDVSEFLPRVSVSRNGIVVAEKYLPRFALPAGGKRTLKVSLPKFDASRSGDYYYLVSFIRTSDTPFAKRGETAAEAQFALSSKPAPAIEIPEGAPETLDAGGKLVVKFDGGSAVFDKASARMESYTFGGEIIVNSPFDFDYFQSSTDHYQRTDSELVKLGLFDLSRKNSKFSCKEEGGYLRVFCKSDFVSKGGKGFALETVYTLAKNGFVNVSSRLEKIGEMKDDLVFARLGTRFGVNPKFSRAAYLGRGPHANYSNRLYSADFGWHKGGVAEFFENFTRPQDTGNREGVKFFALGNGKSGAAFLMQNEPNAVAVLPWTQRELAAVMHPYELAPSTSTDVRITRNISGLAENPWANPRPRPESRVDFKNPKPWNFTIAPFSSEKEMESLREISVPEKFIYRFK